MRDILVCLVCSFDVLQHRWSVATNGATPIVDFFEYFGIFRGIVNIPEYCSVCRKCTGERSGHHAEMSHSFGDQNFQLSILDPIKCPNDNAFNQLLIYNIDPNTVLEVSN